MSGNKLSPVSLGFSLGILWGLTLFVIGLIATHFIYGHQFIAAIGALYLGYEPSIRGSIMGGIIGFVDGFITGFLIAWLYNLFNCSSLACCKKDKAITETKDLNDKH